MKVTKHAAPRYAVFFTLPLLDTFLPKYSRQHPVLKYHVYIPPLMSETNFQAHTESQILEIYFPKAVNKGNVWSYQKYLSR
jgi:hypothetical protein